MADSSLVSLPARVIDTGMGFERLCMALQGKTSNYDTDVFQPILKTIAHISGTTYGENNEQDIAMRVIADHIRTIAFSITDGQLPSNAKAGYVIRRILRRAVRYGYTFLGRREAFMYRLLPVLIETMGDAYPELTAQKVLIEKVIKEEEESFLRTLETGIRMLDKQMDEAKAAGKNCISGGAAFTLNDTFGFPLDLTELILRENGMEVNIDEFNAEMQKQKERARSAAAIETGDWVILKEGDSKFIGYDIFEADVEILRYRKIKQKNKELFQIVLDSTPFYAEMGGQVGDTGVLVSDTETINVIDTKSENNLSVHFLAKMPQDPTAVFRATINETKRIQSECNHTATHLLHEALREVLGTHVEQKGSYVSPSLLRFDFSHFQKMTEEEIRKVEQLVSAKIRANHPLDEQRAVAIEKAKEMGATALFGEKYGDEVRVIRYGESIELCGGTHIPATGMIGAFRIIGESSIAAGVRRIEAVTAEGAEAFLYEQQDTIREIRSMLNNMPNVTQAIKKSIDENAELKKQVEAYMKAKAIQVKQALLEKVVEINGVQCILMTGVSDTEIMKDVAFQIKGELTGKVCFVGAILSEAKPQLMVMLSDELVADGLNAAQLIKAGAKHIQGGGGGQPHFATAGGKNEKGLTIAADAIFEAAGLKQ